MVLRRGLVARIAPAGKKRETGMTASTDEIFETLVKLLEPYNPKGVTLEPDTEIAAELNIDSVGVMDFIMEVEDAFDIDISLNVLSETHTMGDLVRVVEERVNKG